MQTPATDFLAKHAVAYTEHEYEYVERGGTAVSSESLGVPEHEVVKTLVMEDEDKKPLIVLMHGDRTVSTKDLARQANRKRIEPCRPDVAQRHTGYQVGGTSPFGTRKPLPVFIERAGRDLHQRRTQGLPPAPLTQGPGEGAQPDAGRRRPIKGSEQFSCNTYAR